MINSLLEKIKEQGILEIEFLGKKFKCYSVLEFEQYVDSKLFEYEEQMRKQYEKDGTIYGKLKIENFKACFLSYKSWKQKTELIEGDVYLEYEILFFRELDKIHGYIDIVDFRNRIVVKDTTNHLIIPENILFYFKEL